MTASFPPDARRHVILCEGYQDRAFWKGLLVYRGCGESRKDPGGRRVVGGRFGYRTPAGGYVEVIPANSRQKLLVLLREEVEDAEQPPVLGSVIFSFDPDVTDAAAADGVADSQADNFAGLFGAERLTPRPGRPEERAAVRLPATGETLFVAPWRCDPPNGGDRDGVPSKQTLERLACAAVAEVHPDRAAAVKAWLNDDRVTPPERHLHKAAAQSFMAGWQPDRGSEGFFEAVWEDADVRAVLVRLLTAAGTWAAVDRLLGGAPPGPDG